MQHRSLEQQLAGALSWRLVGPYRGGRVMAVAGHPDERMRFFFGSSSGGVWRSDDGGSSWQPIGDSFLRRGSIGALALAPADPQTIYVGTGECGLRSNVSHGDGVYRSQDGGHTWTHQGLAATQNIGRICVDPRDSRLVYLAAFGHRFGPNRERGVFRSRDGGAHWQQVLTQGEHAGAIDLALDRGNPRVLYAAFWEAQLSPWGRKSRGPAGALFRSDDGGDTWHDLRERPGFPAGPYGRIGVCVSPTRAGRVWALIDAPEGGMYRSDDGGEHWTWLNNDRNFLVRSWYFTHLAADPHNPDGVYVINRKLWHSADGGRTYRQLNVPYVDQHDLWIDPRDGQRMILGNDGGAAVSFNGGNTWSTLVNQPTAEIYRAAADTHFPYRIYGSQQDNSTLCMPSRSERGPLSHFEWYDIGGGESGAIVTRPDNPNIVYSGDLPGLGITRYDHSNHQIREIAPWFDGDGQRDDALAYRFNWTTPIALSPHDPNTLYVGGNLLFRSRDEGASWTPISPDLTRNDQTKLGTLGESNTGENAIVNDYCTISTVAESPCEPGVIWVGSDDGLAHLSRDGGASWSDVTPPALPVWATTMIEPSAHAPGCAYLAATLHQLDDFRPYVFKTSDYGQTWTAIVNGLPDDLFVRVVREDSRRRGLLYAGTEAGVMVSLNDGAWWQTLQLNLPAVAVYDLLVHQGDLIAATHGRSMWVLDDLSPLHQLDDELLAAPAHLFAPRPTYRLTRQVYGLDSLLSLYAPFVAANPPAGIVVSYYLREQPEQPITLELLDAAGDLVHRHSNVHRPEPARPIGPLDYELRGGAATLTGKPFGEDEPGIKWGPLTLPPDAPAELPAESGFNRFVLSLLYPAATSVPGAARGGVTAPLAVPGRYQVRLTVGEHQWTVPADLLADPRVTTSQADFEAQFALMLKLRAAVSAVHEAVLRIRALRQQLDERLRPLGEHPAAIELHERAASLRAALTAIEVILIQPQLHERSGELAGGEFPPRLNVKLQALGYAVARSDDRPTQQSYELFDDLQARAERQLTRLQRLLDEDVAAFNALFAASGLPAIV